MDDLISRQAAIELAKDICVPNKDGSVYRHRCIDPDAIRELPSAQPEKVLLAEIKIEGEELQRCIDKAIERIKVDVELERKKGEWINHRNDNGHNIADCSECGSAIQWFDDDEKPKFCCMCGADMRERKEE